MPAKKGSIPWNKGKTYPYSEETKKKMNHLFKKRSIPWNKGKTGVYCDAALKKMASAKIGKKRGPHSEEHKRKISESQPIKTGSNHQSWKGGVYHAARGKCIYFPDHPRAMYNKTYVYEYTLVAEKMLGRYLNKNEVVHHKNKDIKDNSPENLEVLTRAEHISRHRSDLLNSPKWREYISGRGVRYNP